LLWNTLFGSSKKQKRIGLKGPYQLLIYDANGKLQDENIRFFKSRNS
jgi:hypothetical protein